MQNYQEVPFSIIWKYKIKIENKEKFEYEYGKEGTWVRLFSESADYRGSLMYRETTLNDTYIVVDTWRDEKSYVAFCKIIEDIYQSVNQKFSSLYICEERVGGFNQC